MNSKWVIEREGKSVILVTEELVENPSRTAQKQLPRDLVRLVCQNLANATRICEAVMLPSDKQIESQAQRDSAVWLKATGWQRIIRRRPCVVFFAPPTQLLYEDAEDGSEWPGDFLLVAPGDTEELTKSLNKFGLKDYIEYYDAVCRLGVVTAALYDNAELVITASSEEWLQTAVEGIEAIDGCVGGRDVLAQLQDDLEQNQRRQRQLDNISETELIERANSLFSDPTFTEHPAQPPRVWKTRPVTAGPVADLFEDAAIAPEAEEEAPAQQEKEEE